LSFEHVPPKGTGNTGWVEMLGIEAWLALEDRGAKVCGTISQRGSGAYSLCRDCNSRAGDLYVPEFKRLHGTGIQASAGSGIGIFFKKRTPARVVTGPDPLQWAATGSGFPQDLAATPIAEARKRGDWFDSPSTSPSPMLQLSNLSDQELAKVELPVGDETLNQDSQLIAIKPPK
jgi:hypothetical protein